MKLPVLQMLIALVGLVACSPTFSTRVGDFDTPISSNSLEQICWQEVNTSGVPRISSAAFRAVATYDTEALALEDSVELQFFGRSQRPAALCTNSGSGENIAISQTFELERDTSQDIEVGGDGYGSDLAELVNTGRFWLGASARGNVVIGEERVYFESGRITITF